MPSSDTMTSTAPSAVVLVEGDSDRIAVQALAVRRGIDLRGRRIEVVATGGVGGIRRALATHARDGLTRAALCDGGEAAHVRRVIDESGLDVSLFVCEPDLEAELIRAVGMEQALVVLDREGDLRAFTTLQKQAQWRGQPPDAQLRRFIGAGARRKLRYARLFVEAAGERVPRPLADLLAAVSSGS